MPVVWRLLKTRHLAHAWDGEGARRFGGRWNSPGVPVAYASSSLSLALLEVLVHLLDSEALGAWSAIPADVDESLVTVLDPGDLPRGWRKYPAPPAAAVLGDAWVRSGRSAVLQVPSVIVPLEHNYLLNPSHPRFGEIRLGEPMRFPIDTRLR